MPRKGGSYLVEKEQVGEDDDGNPIMKTKVDSEGNRKVKLVKRTIDPSYPDDVPVKKKKTKR